MTNKYFAHRYDQLRSNWLVMPELYQCSLDLMRKHCEAPLSDLSLGR